MNIGWLGAGKLGLTCALTQAHYGHEVSVYDVNHDIETYVVNRAIPYEEEGVAELFAAGTNVRWCPGVATLVEASDIIFVAVQTPHAPAYEGVTTIPIEDRDFDYSYLENAIKALVRVTAKPLTVVVVSTVLPGTTRRVLMPHIERNPHINMVYSPSFIAMGTTVHDYSHPEFVLAGGSNTVAIDHLTQVHRRIHSAPILHMSIESAEMAKVLYNTFISMKILIANTAMEISEKLGANCDDVTRALGLGTDRIVSAKYLRGGMGDGGGCHPRDCTALSWLAERLNLSVNPFRWAMEAREQQARWIASIAQDMQDQTKLPIFICGEEYKKGTNLTTGSSSRLLSYILGDVPTLKRDGRPPVEPGIFIIGCNHDEYAAWNWPDGSVVIDPWGYVADQPRVIVKRLGRR